MGCVVGGLAIVGALVLSALAIVVAVVVVADDESDNPAIQSIRDCFNRDGTLDALEDLVRPLLNDRESMKTHETRISRSPKPDGFYQVRMTFSSKNAFGGRVTAIAHGEVAIAYGEVDPPQDCHVRLIEIIE